MSTDRNTNDPSLCTQDPWALQRQRPHHRPDESAMQPSRSRLSQIFSASKPPLKPHVAMREGHDHDETRRAKVSYCFDTSPGIETNMMVLQSDCQTKSIQHVFRVMPPCVRCPILNGYLVNRKVRGMLSYHARSIMYRCSKSSPVKRDPRALELTWDCCAPKGLCMVAWWNILQNIHNS